MSRITRDNGGIAVTWSDGYLPPREKLVKIIQGYQNFRPEFNPSKLNYEPEVGWSRGDIFRSAAFFMNSDFHARDGEVQAYHQPCSAWLANLKDTNSSLKNIVAETEADPRKDDYYHIISVHRVDEASQCLNHLLENIGFVIKTDPQYQNLEAFHKECEGTINRILEVYTEPNLLTWGILHDKHFNVY